MRELAETDRLAHLFLPSTEFQTWMLTLSSVLTTSSLADVGFATALLLHAVPITEPIDRLAIGRCLRAEPEKGGLLAGSKPRQLQVHRLLLVAVAGR